MYRQDKNRQDKIRELCETSLFIALVFVATFLLKIPGFFGYTHLGDCMIFVAVLMLGWKRGALAGGIGAALADLVGGYAIWILPTLVCKSLMAFVMGLLMEKHTFSLKGRALWVTSAVAGGLLQCTGYTLARTAIYGLAPAIACIPELLFQTGSGIALAFAVSEALQKTALKNHFVYTTHGKGIAESC